METKPLTFKLQLYQGKYLVLGWKRYSDRVWLTSLVSTEGEVEPGSLGACYLSEEEFTALPWVALQVKEDGQ